MIYTCPNCFCDNVSEDFHDCWITCENCNYSFREKEITNKPKSSYDILVEAATKVVDEYDLLMYGPAIDSIKDLRYLLENIERNGEKK